MSEIDLLIQNIQQGLINKTPGPQIIQYTLRKTLTRKIYLGNLFHYSKPQLHNSLSSNKHRISTNSQQRYEIHKSAELLRHQSHHTQNINNNQIQSAH